MTEFIKPNLHNILVHYPVALISLGALIELLSFLYRRHGLRSAGRWVIFLGVLSMLPALASGLYAARQTFHADEGLKWTEIKQQAPLDQHQWELLKTHLTGNAFGAGILLFMVLVFVGSSDRWRRKLYFLHVLLLLWGMSALTVGSHHGGLMVYEGFGTKAKAESVHIEEKSTDEKAQWRDKIERNIPPVEAHLVLAGLTLSMCFAALAISYRRSSDFRTSEHVVDTDIADALTARSMGAFGVNETPAPHIEHVVAVPTPAARFWMLASLVAVLTALAGWWTYGSFNWREAWDYVRDVEHKRVFWHVVFGGALIVLPWIFALFTRFAPRARLFLMLLTLCVLGVAAIQVWLGILLLFDTNQGAVTRFN